MIALHFLLCNKMNRGIIVGEIVRHGYDLLLNPGFISPLLCYHEAFSRVLLSRRKLWLFPVSHGFQSALDGNCILPCILYTFDPAYRVRMPLTDSFAPEGIVTAIRKNRAGIDAV